MIGPGRVLNRQPHPGVSEIHCGDMVVKTRKGLLFSLKFHFLHKTRIMNYSWAMENFELETPEPDSDPPAQSGNDL